MQGTAGNQVLDKGHDSLGGDALPEGSCGCFQRFPIGFVRKTRGTPQADEQDAHRCGPR